MPNGTLIDMHRYSSKIQKTIGVADRNFWPRVELFKRILRAKYVQNSFLSKYLLGLSFLSTAACKGESEDPTSSSKLTEREMNLANMELYNANQMTTQTLFEHENLQNNALNSGIVATAPQTQTFSTEQENLTTTVTTVTTVGQQETTVSQTASVTDAVSQDDNIALIQESINADDIVLTYDLSAGNVVKGPLNHALVFLDIDGDGKPVDEPFVYTKADGSYDLLEAFRNHEGVISKEEMENATLTVLTYENTIDTISDSPLPDLILKAPFGSSVLSPLTTIMNEAELNSIEVANLLDITQQDFYNFNPFSASSDLELALEVEIVGLQFASILTALSGATKGVLADGQKVINPNATKVDEKWITLDNMSADVRAQSLEDLWQELRANLGASEIVLNEIVSVVKNKSESGETLGLVSLADINLIIEALDLTLENKLNEEEGASTQNTLNAMASFRARSEKIGEELVSLNTKISMITELYSKETVETVSLISELSKKVFNAEIGTWIPKDQISFYRIVEGATDKTGSMKLKGSLDAFSLGSKNNPLDVKGVYEENGRFILTWTSNDAKTGNTVQLKTIDDPNGSKKFKATKDQTDFIFDYSFMENNASVKIFVANEGQAKFEFPTEVPKDQIIITRSSEPKRQLEPDEFTFADGVITLSNKTVSNEEIRISESIPAIMVLRSYKDTIVDPVLEENVTATDGQSIVLAEPTVWGEIIKVSTSNAPKEAEIFIADAGQTKFDFSYNIPTEESVVDTVKITAFTNPLRATTISNVLKSGNDDSFDVNLLDNKISIIAPTVTPTAAGEMTIEFSLDGKSHSFDLFSNAANATPPINVTDVTFLGDALKAFIDEQALTGVTVKSEGGSVIIDEAEQFSASIETPGQILLNAAKNVADANEDTITFSISGNTYIFDSYTDGTNNAAKGTDEINYDITTLTGLGDAVKNFIEGNKINGLNVENDNGVLLLSDAPTDQINVFRSKVAKFSRISVDEYSSKDGIVTLKSPTDQNELVEIRKLPADNKVIDLFSSTNFRTSNPEIMRLSDNELIIVSTASNKQTDHSAILVQVQKQDNQKKGIEYSNTESIHIISEDTSVPYWYTTTSSNYTEPVITLTDNKNFVVGWTNNTKGVGGKNVELQVFDENGPAVDKRFTLNDFSYSDQYSLDLINLPTENQIAATWIEVEKDTINTDIIYSHFDISKPSGVNLSSNTISLSISVFGQQIPIKLELTDADFVDGDLVMDREAFGLKPEDFINKVSVQYDPFGQFDRLNSDRTSISEISGARDDLIQAFSKGVNLGEALNVNYDNILGLSVNGPLLSEQSTKITLTRSGSELPINLVLTEANFTNGRLILTAEQLNNQISLGKNEKIISIVAQTDPKGNFDTQNTEGTFTEDQISRLADNIGTWKFETEEAAGNLSLNFDPYLGIMVTGIGELERLNHKNILNDGFNGIKISKNKAEDLDVSYKYIEPPSRIFIAEADQTLFPFQSNATSDQLIISRSYGNSMPLLPEDYNYVEGLITLTDKTKQNESIKITTPSSSIMLSINTSILPYAPNKDNVQVSVEHTGSNQKVLLELEADNFLMANDTRIGENGFAENDLTFSGIQLDRQLDLKPGDEITSIVVQSDPAGNFDQLDINGTFLWDQATKYFDKLGKWTTPNQQELDEFDINFNPTLILPNDGNLSVFWTAWNPQKEIYQLIYRRFDSDGNLSKIITLEDEFSFNPSDFDIATKGNEIFVTWNHTNEMGSSSIVMSSLDPTNGEESVQAQFESNVVTIKNDVDAIKAMPKITFDSENELFVTWIDSPTLTKDHLTDFELVFDLIDLDALNVPLASYTVPENETIDNLKELIPYLLDQNINFLEKDLESQMAMLDDKKVQDYLDSETDMIFYAELSDNYNNLIGSDTGVIA